MAWQKPEGSFHRSLDDKEEGEFRRWARENYDPEEAFSRGARAKFRPDPKVHHPVIVDECALMDKEWQDQQARSLAKPPYGKEVK